MKCFNIDNDLYGYFEHFYETGFSHIKYILKIYF